LLIEQNKKQIIIWAYIQLRKASNLTMKYLQMRYIQQKELFLITRINRPIEIIYFFRKKISLTVLKKSPNYRAFLSYL